MIQKTEALVLHYIPYTETSIIAQLFTSDYGRVSVLIPGVRQAKARNKMALFMPLNRIWVEIDYRPKRDLQRLREVGLVGVYQSLHSNVAKNAIGLFVAELLYKALIHEQRNDSLYEFLVVAIEYLDKCEGSVANFHLIFAVQLSRYLGFFPLCNFDSYNAYFNLRQGSFNSWPGQDTLSAHDSALFAKLLESSFSSMQTIPLTGELRNSFLLDIMRYYSFHIPNFKGVNAVSVFRELF